MGEIKWIKKYMHKSQEFDVSIRAYHHKERGTYYWIKMRDEIVFDISEDGYVDIGILGNRMYFRKGNKGDSYKFTKDRTDRIYSARINRNHVLEDFVGWHDMHRSDEEKMYFIEIEDQKRLEDT